MLDSYPNYSSNCQSYFYDEEPTHPVERDHIDLNREAEEGNGHPVEALGAGKSSQQAQHTQPSSDMKSTGFRRIIRNFTPS
jgi:hypothetical protein